MEKDLEFSLEPWRLELAPSLARYADNRKIAEKLRDSFPNPYSLEDAVAFITSCLDGKMEQGLMRAIVINGEAVGSIGLTLGSDIYCRSAQLGYFLGEPFWRRGIMSAAVGLICQKGFETLEIERIYAEPFLHNTASRRVLENNSFNLEGIKRCSICKNGQIYDSCMYAITRTISLD